MAKVYLVVSYDGRVVPTAFATRRLAKKHIKDFNLFECAVLVVQLVKD